MRQWFPRTVWLWVAIASLGILACDASTVTNLVVGMTGAKPTVTIQSPSAGSVFREGDDVSVTSIAKDQQGVARVELAVDGSIVSSDAPPVPQAQTTFTLVQRWKATEGTHTLSVRAFNGAGQASDPALVSIMVSAVSGQVTPLPTAPPSPTATAVLATPIPAYATATSNPASSTAASTATRTPTRKSTAAPSATAIPSATPIKAQPGVWALSIRVDPKQPYRGVAPTFFVTFFNNTGAPAYYSMYVKVFEPDKTNAKGETSKADVVIPPGTSELAAPADWKIVGPGLCESFNARVFSYTKGTKEFAEISKPDGSGSPIVSFQVCP